MNRALGPYNWRRWCFDMPRLEVSSHFDFHGVQRNRCNEPKSMRRWNPGVHGVRDDWLLPLYRTVLEDAWQRLRSIGRSQPLTDNDGRIPVFLFAVDDPSVQCGSPMMEELWFPKLRRHLPVLILPSRFAFATRIEAERYAASCAVHELSHALNSGDLPELPGVFPRPDRDLFYSWLSFDEGMALAAEAELLPGNLGWAPYGLNWTDRPERSLDDLNARYQAFLFVRYLDRLMSARGLANFSSRVWHNSQTVWGAIENPNIRAQTALTAIDGLLAEEKLIFVSANADVQDIFASGYCMDSYFLGASNTIGNEPELFAAFQNRAITRSWTLGRGKNIQEAPWNLAPLACRYFRFCPKDNSGRLKVEVEVHRGIALKAELAISVDGSNAMLARVPARREERNGKQFLICALNHELVENTHDHAVLVITNCSGSGITTRREDAEFSFRASFA